jgi:hypothetical protein
MPAYIGAGGQICIVPMSTPSSWGYRPDADVAGHWDDYADNARRAGYHRGKVQ